MDDYYTKIAKGYDELHKEEQELKISLIKKELPNFFELKKEDLLLDVGCGTGISTVSFDCKRTGVDPSKGLLELAHKKNEIKYFNASAENLPFENDKFDIVISLTAIQNFENLEKGLNEIRRVGKSFFILTYLKKSQKAQKIEKLIQQFFNVKKRIEEDKDIIFFCAK